MTGGCLLWIERMLADLTIGGPVLEVGSLDVNGSARELFYGPTRFPSYVGVDIQSGPGVDGLANAHDLPFPDETFGLVLCTEMLEHDDRPWVSVREFHRVLAEGGRVMVTTRGIGFPRHDYPSDFWRFTAEGLRTLLCWGGFRPQEAVTDSLDQAVYGLAAKGLMLEPYPMGTDRRMALLTGEELARLRERFRGFTELGLTGLADAFERVAMDRDLLLLAGQRDILDFQKNLLEALGQPGPGEQRD